MHARVQMRIWVRVHERMCGGPKGLRGRELLWVGVHARWAPTICLFVGVPYAPGHPLCEACMWMCGCLCSFCWPTKPRSQGRHGWTTKSTTPLRWRLTMRT